MLNNKILSKIKAHPLYSEEKKIVVSRGQGNSELMFIGEAPGKDENRVGEPFVGRSGKLVDKWIESYGINNYVITNIVPLIPLTEEGKIRKPTSKEIDYFSFFIKHMIDTYKPRKIICLGATATEGYLGKKISESVFRVNRLNNILSTAIYHPAYYLRRGQDGIDVFKKTYSLLKDNSKQKKLF